MRLLISLLVLSILSGCKPQPSVNVFVDPALATLVPSDTKFIGGVRVQQLQPTPVFQQYVLGGKLPFVERFGRETGIDVRRALWEVLISHDWVMLRGKFTEMGMEPRVKREGAQRIGYKGYTMLGDERIAVLFLNPTTAVAGPVQALKRIIDNRNQSTGIPSWLQEEIRSIPATNQLWFAGDATPYLSRFTGLTLTGGIDFRSGVTAHVVGVANSAEDARSLADTVRASASRTNLSGIELRSDGSTVDVRVNVPAGSLESLLDLIVFLRE